MPQTNLALPFVNPSKATAYGHLDAFGNQLVNAGGSLTSLDITARLVVKATAGRLVRINVLVAGAVGAAYDYSGASGEAATNEIFVIPATVGTYELNWPCAVGILIAPGASQVVSVSYD